MANKKHLAILKQGVDVWNKWREEHPEIIPDLSSAVLSGEDLSSVNFTSADHNRVRQLDEAIRLKVIISEADTKGANLSDADLSFANLSQANLSKADFARANLSEANLSDVDLSFAHLSEANLKGTKLSGAYLFHADLKYVDLSYADLSGADLSGADLESVSLLNANLSHANLSHANLIRADFFNANLSEATLNEAVLTRAILIQTNLYKATLTNCWVYGISAWDVNLAEADQSNLYILDSMKTPALAATITVDNLKMAQFIYLLLNNADIRDVIDTLTSKVVLILGRFKPERKAILDTLRNELRKRNYSPVLFDFEKPANRDITETVSTLAHLARFVIADITEPKSIPQELSQIIPFLPSVPIVPLLQVAEREYGMYEHFISYPWVQPIYHYHDLDELLQSIQEQVIEPAGKRVRELAIEKAIRLAKP